MEELKKCRACQEEKPLQQFQTSRRCRDGRTRTCKTCFSERYKERNRKRAALRYLENPEIFKKRTKLYAKNNPEKIKEIYRNRNKNPVFRAKRNLRTRMKVLLAAKDISYDCSVGCTRKELMSHLESKMLIGMTWDNYGKINGWCIDHIKPLESFDLTKKEERNAANNFKNLQPLWRSQNEKKNDNYDSDHPMGWHGLNELLSEEDKKLLGEKYKYNFGQK